jgi:hypothetical protein
MRPRQWIYVAVGIAAPFMARAQHGGGGAPLATRAPREASQYDFLIGQWDLTITPRVSGLAARIHGVPRLRGTWKGWRALDGWGVEDELRVVDESGNPQALTQFVRVYDPGQKGWSLATVDAYRQQITQSTARWTGSEMVVTNEGTDGDGTRYLSRTRVSSITPSSFHYQQERSYDNGKTWQEPRLVIEAKRVAAVARR